MLSIRTCCWVLMMPVLFLGTAQAKCDKQPTKPATFTVTDKDNNGKASLRQGDMLNVRLESNPTTGYTWQVTKNNKKALKPIGEPAFEPPKTNKNLVGAPGHQKFVFKAIAPGTVALQLTYLRPWEKPPKDTKTYLIKAEVKKRK